MDGETGEVGGVGDPLHLVRQAGDGEAAVADGQVAGDAEVLRRLDVLHRMLTFQGGNNCHVDHSQRRILTRSQN